MTDKAFMKLGLLIFFILSSSNLWSQTKKKTPDPCDVDFKSPECVRQMENVIFFSNTPHGMNKSISNGDYLNSYFMKYGAEGFLTHHSSEYTSRTLLDRLIADEDHDEFTRKVLVNFPKDQEVAGRNIYQMVISDFNINPFRDQSSDRFLYFTNVLFPQNGNGEFLMTKETYGFPWKDPKFMTGYLHDLQAKIKQIDDNNAFFPTKHHLQSREALGALTKQLEEVAKIPEKVCEINTTSEYGPWKEKYGNILESASFDVLGCMIKKGKLKLAMELMKEQGYQKEKIASYFDQVKKLGGNNPHSLELAAYLMQVSTKETIDLNLKSNQWEFQVVNSAMPYLLKHPELEVLDCDYKYNSRNSTIGNLAEDLQLVMFKQAYSLMEKILAEQDPKQKEVLLAEFLDIYKTHIDLSRVNPRTGKTILHLIAEAADKKVFAEIMKIEPYPEGLGMSEKNKDGLTPMYYLLAQKDKAHLELAMDLFAQMTNPTWGEQASYLKEVRRIRPRDDQEIKELKDQLKFRIKESMDHTY